MGEAWQGSAHGVEVMVEEVHPLEWLGRDAAMCTASHVPLSSKSRRIVVVVECGQEEEWVASVDVNV